MSATQHKKKKIPSAFQIIQLQAGIKYYTRDPIPAQKKKEREREREYLLQDS